MSHHRCKKKKSNGYGSNPGFLLFLILILLILGLSGGPGVLGASTSTPAEKI